MCNPRQELSNAFNTITGWVDRGLTGIGKTFDAIAKDPLPTIATVALTAVGVPPYVTSLARTAMSGGNMDNYVIGLVTSYAGSQIGAAAGDLAFPELGDVAGYGGFGDVAFQPTATDAILKTVISNASAQGATALLQGKELDQVFNSALTGAVGGLINTTLRTELGLDPSKIEGKLISDATKAAVGSILNNQDPALAIGNALSQSAFGTLANTAAAGLKSVVSDLNKTVTDFETTQSEATTLRGEIDTESTRLSGIASILNSESTALNTKQQTLKNSYDLVNLSGQIYDWRSNTINYSPAANAAYAQRMGLVEGYSEDFGTYYVNPTTNEFVISLGIHAKDTLEKQADYLNTNIPQFESNVTSFNTKLATFNTDKTKLDDKVDTYDGYVTKLFGEDGNGGLNKTIQDLLVDRDKYVGDLDKSITGLSEVAGEEISDVAKRIATEAVETFDQNFRTSDEVTDAFSNNPLFADYEASPADIAKFVGEGADTDLQTLVNSFVDERTLDATELADIAQKEGLTLTQDDLLALVQQGDEKELTKQFTEQFDKQAVTRDEAKSAFGGTGYTPTEQDLDQFVGNRSESQLRQNVEAYADPRVYDINEAIATARSEGIELGAADLLQLLRSQSIGQMDEATAQSKLAKQFDEQYVRPDEARQKLIDSGWANPTQEQIDQFAGKRSEATAFSDINDWVDARTVTREEAQQFFDDIGFEPSDEQLLQFIGNRDESSAFKDIEEFVTGQRELDAQKAGFPDYATQQQFDNDIDAYKASQPRADVEPAGTVAPLAPLAPGFGVDELFGLKPSTEPFPYALEENAKEFVTPPVVEPPVVEPPVVEPPVVEPPVVEPPVVEPPVVEPPVVEPPVVEPPYTPGEDAQEFEPEFFEPPVVEPPYTPGEDADEFEPGAGTVVDTLTGGLANDLLGDETDEEREAREAREAEDIIYGGTGNDTATAVVGDETLEGGSGNDTFKSVEGEDTVAGGAGNDTVQDFEGEDTLTGGVGNDTVTAGADTETLTGGAGNDAVFIGTDTETVSGGEGNDVVITDPDGSTITLGPDGEVKQITDVDNNVVYDSSTDQETPEGGAKSDFDVDTDAGSLGVGTDAEGIDVGAEGEDTGETKADNIVIEGESGSSVTLDAKGSVVDVADADGNKPSNVQEVVANVISNPVNVETVKGAGGADITGGEAGEDTAQGAGSDAATGETKTGNIVITGENGATVTLAPDGSLVDVTNAEGNQPSNVQEVVAAVISNPVNIDTLEGATGNYTFVGGEGDDTFVGGEGNDTFVIGGDDTLIGGEGNDTFVGDGQDTIDGGVSTTEGGEGNDTLFGAVGNDTLTAEGDDTFIGGDGRDTDDTDTDLGGGEDTGVGADGEATATGGDATDLLFGVDATDTLFGGDQNDTLIGGDETDIVLDDSDTLIGGDENDTLTGENADDTLIGGDENDTLIGGDENDSLVSGDVDDLLTSGDENDTLFGGDENDSLIGGDANDLVVEDELDELDEQTLLDLIKDDTLFGGDADDTLLGGDENDSLVGGDANDTLGGGEGTQPGFGFEVEGDQTGRGAYTYVDDDGNVLIIEEDGTMYLTDPDGNQIDLGNISTKFPLLKPTTPPVVKPEPIQPQPRPVRPPPKKPQLQGLPAGLNWQQFLAQQAALGPMFQPFIAGAQQPSSQAGAGGPRFEAFYANIPGYKPFDVRQFSSDFYDEE